MGRGNVLKRLAAHKVTEDYLVACTVATEVPPIPSLHFPKEMIPIAIAAVCDVIQNRVEALEFPHTAVEVVLQIKQFSGVLRGVRLRDVGHRDIWSKVVARRWFPGHVAECRKIWRGKRGTLEATHYYSPVSMIPTGRVPQWALSMDEVLVPGLNRDYFRFFV